MSTVGQFSLSFHKPFTTFLGFFLFNRIVSCCLLSVYCHIYGEMCKENCRFCWFVQNCKNDLLIYWYICSEIRRIQNTKSTQFIIPFVVSNLSNILEVGAFLTSHLYYDVKFRVGGGAVTLDGNI